MDITSKTVGVLLDAQTLTATATGAAVSTTGVEETIALIARVGTPGNSTGILNLQVQTSADGATNWQNLGPVLGPFTATGGSASQNINPASSLGYIRLVATLTGTTPTFPFFALYIATPQYR